MESEDEKYVTRSKQKDWQFVFVVSIITMVSYVIIDTLLFNLTVQLSIIFGRTPNVAVFFNLILMLLSWIMVVVAGYIIYGKTKSKNMALLAGIIIGVTIYTYAVRYVGVYVSAMVLNTIIYSLLSRNGHFIVSVTKKLIQK